MAYDNICESNSFNKPVQSSLLFQLLIVANAFYFVIFFLLELALFGYKGATLPYPNGALAGEIIGIFLLAGVEIIQVYLGYRGNLTENTGITAACLIFSIASFFGALYYLLWETYVLLADAILASILIVLIGLESILGLISIILFARRSRIEY